MMIIIPHVNHNIFDKLPHIISYDSSTFGSVYFYEKDRPYSRFLAFLLIRNTLEKYFVSYITVISLTKSTRNISIYFYTISM